MSVHVISWVFRNSPTTLADRLVLLVLADHASADGTDSYPSVKTIAHEARISERQVQYSLRALEKVGAIKAVGRSPLRTTEFVILMGAESAPSWVQNAAEVGAGSAPEPSLTVKPSCARTREEHRCDRCPGGLTLVSAQRLAEHLFVVHGVE